MTGFEAAMLILFLVALVIDKLPWVGGKFAGMVSIWHEQLDKYEKKETKPE
jgi:hypothetical protein